MYFMSCILLRCKWPFGPFAFNKLIDWLICVWVCVCVCVCSSRLADRVFVEFASCSLRQSLRRRRRSVGQYLKLLVLSGQLVVKSTLLRQLFLQQNNAIVRIRLRTQFDVAPWWTSLCTWRDFTNLCCPCWVTLPDTRTAYLQVISSSVLPISVLFISNSY